MTRRDKWMRRACVLKYRDWADEIRKAAVTAGFAMDSNVSHMSVTFYIAFPDSYSKAMRMRLAGQPHRLKPDIDNCAKSISDPLLKNDQCIWSMECKKFWDDGLGPRAFIGMRVE